ncbi:MAG: hypothetical protein ABI167_04810 [Nitrosospira sp.]
MCGRIALRLELEEFTQVFDTADRSRPVVRLRASLIKRSTRLLLAQHQLQRGTRSPHGQCRRRGTRLDGSKRQNDRGLD